MTSILIDIGRGHVRFGVMNDDDVITTLFRIPSLEAVGSHKKFTDFVRSVSAQKLGIEIDEGVEVAIAGCGPFTGDVYSPMYMPGPKGWWDYGVANVRNVLSPNTNVVHDVAAGALSISQLRHDDVKPFLIGRPEGHERQPNQSTLYIQTGIGLGVSALITMSNGAKLPFSSEGASDTIAPFPGDADERLAYDGLNARKNRYGYMTALYMLEPATLACIHESLHGASLSPELVTSAATQGDRAALRTLDVYVGFLGTFAGNMAMTLRAYDGVYIAGTVPTVIAKMPDKFLNKLKQKFKDRFSNRESENLQLRNVPVTIVTNEYNIIFGLRDLVRNLR